MPQNCLIRSPSVFKVIASTMYWVLFGCIFTYVILNIVIERLGDLEYIYILVLLETPILLITYQKIMDVLNNNYYLNEIGINSDQFKNKEFGSQVPWDIVKSTSIHYEKRNTCILIKLSSDINLKCGFFYGQESEVKLNTAAHTQSIEYLLKEIDLYRHQFLTKNG